MPPDLIRAFALLKLACAAANRDLGKLDEDRYHAAIAKVQEDLKRDLLQLIPDLDADALDRHIQATNRAYRELKALL